MNSVPFRFILDTSGHNKSWHEIRKLVSLLRAKQTLIQIHKFIMRENIRANQIGNGLFFFSLLFPVQTKWPNNQFDVNQKIDFEVLRMLGPYDMKHKRNAIERTLKQICWRSNLLANFPVLVEHSETLNIGHFTRCLCHVKHLF